VQERLNDKPANGLPNQLIEETATVVDRDGDYVLVESLNSAGCSSCGASSRCGTGMLSGILGKRRNLLRIRDHLGLQVGEQVTLGTPSGQLAKAAAVTYLLPLLLMVTTAIGATGLDLDDGGVMVTALGGLMFGFLLVQLISRRHESGLVEVQLLGRAPAVTEHFIQFVKQ
jgi:sigma-E factor negative regulatory protein RseC